MSKIIVRRQEYANNGTHANEIEEVVKQNLIANTLSSATDIAASVGLVKSETDAIKESLTKKTTRIYEWATNYFSYTYLAAKADANEVDVYGYIGLNSPLTSGTQYNLFGLPDLTATWSSATVYSGVTFLGVPFYIFPYTSDKRYFQIIPRGAITASDYIIMNMTIQR